MSLKNSFAKKLKSQKKFVELFFVILIVLTIFILYFSLNLSYLEYSDGANFADIIRQIYQTNQIHITHLHSLATPQMNLPMFYPQLFFIEVACLNLFFMIL